MTTIPVELPDEVLAQLTSVAFDSGLSPAAALRDRLADLADFAIAEQRRDDLMAGRTAAAPLAEVIHRWNLDA